ncbi:SfnB family sulfur acquisition oxidoreductase [Carnimonas bestiolae]|uniref:SfnB family sulfur acquisition oxidoreductase n=1 Tax=Carnimonas bestiolae TaxID=3402172 RepID=UPI003EDBF71D
MSTISAASSPRHTTAQRIESEQQALEVARTLAQQFAQGAAQRDRQREAPLEELDAYSGSGLWAITVPREYGGIGASWLTVARLFTVISQADPSLGQLAQNHFGFVDVIARNGNEAHKRELFELILNGARIGNALSEKRNQRDQTQREHVGVFKTLITVLDSKRARVDGTKFYSTGALFADLIPVMATNEVGGVEVAIFDRDTDGLTVINDWSSFGQRTTFSGTVEIDGAILPRSRVLAAEIPGAASPNGAVSQLLQAAIDLGIGEAALADTLDYLRHRARPWVDSGVEKATDDPLTLLRVGRLETQHEAADALLERAALAIQLAEHEGSDASVDKASVTVAKAKIATTEFALEAANRLFELSGTSSTLDEFGYDRHWRNARVHTLHDPVRWKLHLVGNYSLNGTPPNRHAWN